MEAVDKQAGVSTFYLSIDRVTANLTIELRLGRDTILVNATIRFFNGRARPPSKIMTCAHSLRGD
jgi:hypothetical protein